jgi:broad specificity phosphatase PhoE
MKKILTDNWRYRFVEFWVEYWDLQKFFASPRALPRNLVLIRHGESIGNVAVERMYKHQDDSLFREWQLLNRHSKTWELTPKGREQARACGIWMRDNGLHKFDHGYVSKYDRAMQTAALLGMAGEIDVKWHRPKVILRERDRGMADIITVADLETDFAHVKRGEEQEKYLYRFPNGESLADVELRLRAFNNTLEREAANQDVAVCFHGEGMDVAQVYYEGISLEEYADRKRSKNPHDKIHNCQIIHYTREVEGSQELTPFFNRVRSVCPWNMELSSNIWRPIKSHLLDHQELIDLVPERTFEAAS